VSDLDGTLLGDNASLKVFARSLADVRHSVRLAYSSGRFYRSVCRSIEEFELPKPDAIISGVGTEIFDVSFGGRISEWPQLRGEWNRETVITTCLELPGLELQPAEFLSEYKVSFYGFDLDGDVLHSLRHRLTSAGQAVSIIYSSNRDLDVIPRGVHKGAAAAYLARRWYIDDEQIIVAGDSGNDLSMFLAGFRGIVVANAQPELRSLAGSNVFHSTGCFAAGVTEGMRHWCGDLWSGPARSTQSSAVRSEDRDTL
jgi:sucrose-6F-phosphate phosphohydrolase